MRTATIVTGLAFCLWGGAGLLAQWVVVGLVAVVVAASPRR